MSLAFFSSKFLAAANFLRTGNGMKERKPAQVFKIINGPSDCENLLS